MLCAYGSTWCSGSLGSSIPTESVRVPFFTPEVVNGIGITGWHDQPAERRLETCGGRKDRDNRDDLIDGYDSQRRKQHQPAATFLGRHTLFPVQASEWPAGRRE